MRIGKREVSPSAPAPYVIAEIGSAHQGDIERCKTITRAAAEAGADCVKYQVWSQDESFTPDHPQYALFGDYEFSRSQWLDVMAYARSLAIAIAVDVDDVASTELAVEGGADVLKIRTTNLAYHELLRVVAGSGKPVILATGASTLEEIAQGLAVLDDHGALDVMLMHGFQAFPTAAQDTHLRCLSLLQERFGRLTGYADHADGDSPLAFLQPAAALAAGACTIEKHITIDREKKTEDYESSLNGPQFKTMITQLRQVWDALGGAEHDLTEAELAYRKRFKKSIVARSDIACGQTVTADQIAFKIGAQMGISIDQQTQVIGQTAAVDIAANTVIRPEMLQSQTQTGSTPDIRHRST